MASRSTQYDERRTKVPPNGLALRPKTISNSFHSIKEYLAQSFSNPTVLMQHWALADVMLSGSRALEYFFRKSCTPQSDWDFYVSCFPEHIECAIKGFKDSGVAFDDVWKPLKDVENAKPNETVSIHVQVISRWRKRISSTLGQQRAQRDLNDKCFNLLKRLTDETDENASAKSFHAGNAILDLGEDYNNVKIKISHWHTSYGDLSLFTITGQTTHNDSKQKVQLMFHPKRSNIDQVLAFYASHVQCFITAFGAAHLYYSLAKEKKAIYWLRNSQHHKSAVKAIFKYQERGWTFIIPDNTLESCDSSFGEKCGTTKFIDFPFIPQTAFQRACYNTYTTLKWRSHEGKTGLSDAQTTPKRFAVWDCTSNDPVMELVRKYTMVFDEPPNHLTEEPTYRKIRIDRLDEPLQ